MLHVNRSDGLTISVSEKTSAAQIAKRTVLSEDALGVLVPILQDIVGWNSMQIRSFFSSRGLVLQVGIGFAPIGLPFVALGPLTLRSWKARHDEDQYDRMGCSSTLIKSAFADCLRLNNILEIGRRLSRCSAWRLRLV